MPVPLVYVLVRKGLFIKDVRSNGVGSDADKCGQGGGGLIACGRPQLSIALLAVQLHAFLITATVTVQLWLH